MSISEELKELVEEYGGKLTIPPDKDYKNINIIEVEDEVRIIIENIHVL